jgi:hypothetical protein
MLPVVRDHDLEAMLGNMGISGAFVTVVSHLGSRELKTSFRHSLIHRRFILIVDHFIRSVRRVEMAEYAAEGDVCSSTFEHPFCFVENCSICKRIDLFSIKIVVKIVICQNSLQSQHFMQERIQKGKYHLIDMKVIFHFWMIVQPPSSVMIMHLYLR